MNPHQTATEIINKFFPNQLKVNYSFVVENNVPKYTLNIEQLNEKYSFMGREITIPEYANKSPIRYIVDKVSILDSCHKAMGIWNKNILRPPFFTLNELHDLHSNGPFKINWSFPEKC